uniref:Patatin n=1 Tax=Globodera pallida TaxID=36090 RepID=A0A183CPX8_GLOPA
IQLARLSPAVYPEYARVFRLLSGRTREVNYRRLLGTSVRTIGTATTTTTNATTTGPKASTTTTGGAVLLFSTTEQHQHRGRQDMTMQQQHHQQQQQQLREQSFRALAVCIGRRSDLPMLKEYLPNSDFTYEFNTRYQSVTDPALFAVGAMAGDHFVRYLVGGALCVAQTIINGRQQQQQRQKKQQQHQRVQAVHPAATEVLPLSERVEDADRKRQVHRRLRDRLGTGCAILRTAAVASTAANPLVATTAAVARAKQFIGRAKSQLQLKTTTVV